jgi:hypothetical protein
MKKYKNLIIITVFLLLLFYLRFFVIGFYLSSFLNPFEIYRTFKFILENNSYFELLIFTIYYIYYFFILKLLVKQVLNFTTKSGKTRIVNHFNNLTIGQKILIITIVFISTGIFYLNGGISKSSTSNQSCIGDEGCISQVRSNFSNTGKTILGEQYLGDGKFGISFLDSQYYGASYNATVSTDCNCNVSIGSVSTVQ